MVVIVMGPSASGKDTFVRHMIEAGDGKFSKLLSVTTRPMRDGEVEGVEYNFTSTEEFTKRIKSQDFVEYRSYDTLVDGKPDTWYYGTPKFEPSMNLRFVIKDPKGACQIAKYCEEIGEPYLLLLVKCDEETRTKRAEKRGSFNESEWNRRLMADREDFANDTLDVLAEAGIKNSLFLLESTDDEPVMKSRELLFLHSFRSSNPCGQARYKTKRYSKKTQTLMSYVREISLGWIEYAEALLHCGFTREEITRELMQNCGCTGKDIIEIYANIDICDSLAATKKS